MPLASSQFAPYEVAIPRARQSAQWADARSQGTGRHQSIGYPDIARVRVLESRAPHERSRLLASVSYPRLAFGTRLLPSREQITIEVASRRGPVPVGLLHRHAPSR